MERRLGRGLQSLLSPATPPPQAETATPRGTPIDALIPNSRQPRELLDESALDQLAASIRKSGILQPIVVRRIGEKLEIIAGERRWRAARLAGLTEVPVVVREHVPDDELLELALLENVQRVDLNPIEKARAYRRLVQEFGKTTEEIAATVGLDRATVSNTMRLLDLLPEVQAAVQRGAISAGHARALLAVPSASKRRSLFERILREDLSVRDVELAAADEGGRTKQGARRANPLRPSWVSELERRWRDRLGVKVVIHLRGPRARIDIRCAGSAELDRVTDLVIGAATPRHEVRAATDESAS